MLTILLHSAETWCVTEVNRERLEAFHHSCLTRTMIIIIIIIIIERKDLGGVMTRDCKDALQIIHRLAAVRPINDSFIKQSARI